MSASLEELQAAFEAAGQGHVFNSLDKLSEEQKEELLSNLRDIDLAQLQTLTDVIQKSEKAVKSGEVKISPFENIIDVPAVDAEERDKWRQAGLGLISQGRVAALLMAGGQNYERQNVYFFCQATLPCLTVAGKLLMETYTKPSRSPNGNGGIYEALQTSGALKDMKERGIAEVFVYSVDNALCQVADPEFVGYCFINSIDFGNKVLQKTDPNESVGVLALKDGKPAVIEYSELSESLAKQRNDDGSLAFRCANIAIHCLSVAFLEHAISTDIPFHVAHKKIPVADENGVPVKPTSNNGVKLEKFIFDALALATTPCAFMVERTGNFTAVKNAPDQGLADSPNTARADVSAYHIKLIEAAGGSVKHNADDAEALCEISPLVSYAGENLEERVQSRHFVLPLHLH